MDLVDTSEFMSSDDSTTLLGAPQFVSQTLPPQTHSPQTQPLQTHPLQTRPPQTHQPPQTHPPQTQPPQTQPPQTQPQHILPTVKKLPQVSTTVTIFIVTIFLFFGVINNVGASMMGYVMPIFPAFLLYFTTLLYSLLFLMVAIYNGEQPLSEMQRTTKKWRQYKIMALWTTINGMLFQFSNVWVDGDLQQVLINSSVVFTFVMAYLYFRKLPSRGEGIGYCVVLVGIIVGIIPAINNLRAPDQNRQSDKVWWVLVFVASVFFGVLQEVQQEHAFNDDIGCQKATSLFWFNFMSLPMYLIAILLEAVPYLNGTWSSTSIQSTFVNQQSAFLCYFNTPTNYDSENGNCLEYSWLWPNVFIVGYVGYYYFYAVLIQRYGVVFATVLNSLIPPLAAGVFNSVQIVGSENQKQFNYLLGISFGIIVMGIVIKTKYNNNNNNNNTSATDPLGQVLLSSNALSDVLAPE